MREITPVVGVRPRPRWIAPDGSYAPREAVPRLLVSLGSPSAQAPLAGRPGDAGLDLFVSRRVWVQPGSFVDVHSDVSVQLPPGYWARITGRSSTLRKRGLLVNEAVIDNGYTGELYAGVWNMGSEPVRLEAGERIAQLILHQLHPVAVVLTEQPLVSSDGRGSAGFGSSGP